MRARVCVAAGRAAEPPGRVPGSDGSSRPRCRPSRGQPALPHQDQTPPGISLPGTHHKGVLCIRVCLIQHQPIKSRSSNIFKCGCKPIKFSKFQLSLFEKLFFSSWTEHVSAGESPLEVDGGHAARVRTAVSPACWHVVRIHTHTHTHAHTHTHTHTVQHNKLNKHNINKSFTTFYISLLDWRIVTRCKWSGTFSTACCALLFTPCKL